MAAFKYIGLAIVIIGSLLWLIKALPPLPHTTPFVMADGTTLVASPLPVASEDGPATLEGVVMHDTGGGVPVPYIEYQFKKGVRTKELLFRDTRGCFPRAGDLPCVPGVGTPVPQLSDGEHLRVTGIIRGDQIMVDSFQES